MSIHCRFIVNDRFVYGEYVNNNSCSQKANAAIRVFNSFVLHVVWVCLAGLEINTIPSSR